jgi:Mg/Co/Ni transporter MgtE
MRGHRVLPHEHWQNLEQLPGLFPGGADRASATRLSEISPDRAARILTDIPLRQALVLMDPLDDEYLASVMSNVDSDRRRRLLTRCGCVEREAILNAMPPTLACAIRSQLQPAASRAESP